MALVDFEHDPIDAAVRLGSGNWPGLEALPLCTCQAISVASPDLLKSNPSDRWKTFSTTRSSIPARRIRIGITVARFANPPRLERQGDLVLDSDMAAIKAAEAGLGVTLAVVPKGVPLLQERRLRAICLAASRPAHSGLLRFPAQRRQGSLADGCLPLDQASP